MTDDHSAGHTNSERPITDAEITRLAAEAEAGYDVDVTRFALPRCRLIAPGLAPASSPLGG